MCYRSKWNEPDKLWVVMSRNVTTAWITNILTDFHNFFTGTLSSKCAIFEFHCIDIPSDLKRFAVYSSHTACRFTAVQLQWHFRWKPCRCIDVFNDHFVAKIRTWVPECIKRWNNFEVLFAVFHELWQRNIVQAGRREISSPSPNVVEMAIANKKCCGPTLVGIATRIGPTTFCMVQLNRPSPKTPC